MSLYTNITQEEEINKVCTAYKNFYKEMLPIPKRSLGKAFANIFMTQIETQILDKEPISCLFGNVTSTTYSLFGTPIEMPSNSSLNKQINTTEQ